MISALAVRTSLSVSCLNQNSCPLITSGDAYCYGYRSCAIIQTPENVYLYGYEATGSGLIITTKEDYIYGGKGGHYAIIHADTVHVHGWMGAFYAEIDQYNVENQIKVYLEGVNAGWGTEITCHAPAGCQITCGEENGCWGTDIYCDAGATCTYTCEDTAVQCPEVTQIPAGLPDVEIQIIKEKNRKAKKDKHPIDDDDFHPDPDDVGNDGIKNADKFILFKSFDSAHMTIIVNIVIIIIIISMVTVDL